MPSFDELVREIVRDELPKILPSESEGSESWLDTRQVAELTGLSNSYFEVGRSMNSPDQPPYFKIGRSVRYKKSDVEAWMASRPKRGV